VRVARDLTPLLGKASQDRGSTVFDMGPEHVGWWPAVNLPEGLVQWRHGSSPAATAEVPEQTNGTLFTPTSGGPKANRALHLLGARAAALRGGRASTTTASLRRGHGPKSSPGRDLITGAVRALGSGGRKVRGDRDLSPLVKQAMAGTSVGRSRSGNMASASPPTARRRGRSAFGADGGTSWRSPRAACFKNMDTGVLFFTKGSPDSPARQTADGRFSDFSPHPSARRCGFSGVRSGGRGRWSCRGGGPVLFGDKRSWTSTSTPQKKWVDYVHSTKTRPSGWRNSRGND